MKRALLLLALGLVSQLQAQNTFTIAGLQTEHLENPIGLDSYRPRLAWHFENAQEGTVQSSYRLLVNTDSMALVNGTGSQWDTKKVKSHSMLIRYTGKRLDPFTRYYWQVICQDQAGHEVRSDIASFETGMMSPSNWTGCWISDGRRMDYEAAPCFRKRFQVEKEVRSARAYVAVAGLFELHVNGQRIGDHLLDPLYTRYDRRNLYVTFDVTKQLRQQENVVGIVLGNGWYNHQAIGVWDFERAPWRNRPAFCMDLRITYTDGSTQVISSDLSWRTTDSPWTKDNIYTGEQYDFNKQLTGWDAPGYKAEGWHGVSYRSVPSHNVTAQAARPIRACEELKAVKFTKLSDSVFVYDFGKNMAGITRIHIRGPKGAVLRVRHGERLTEDGHLDQSNIDVYYRGDKQRDPFQTDILTLSGEDDQFMAQFGYKGFQYVEVDANQSVPLDEQSVTAYFVHSDVPSVGKIESSNTFIEKLMAAARQSYLSNLMGLPTDCPQREKNGWTGDGHFAIEAALYNYDGITVYEKWLADHRDEQQPNGVLPDIIPTDGWGYGTDNGLDWTSTIAIIPWNLYLFYGDNHALHNCYQNIRRYVNYVDRIAPNHLTTWGRGDWVPVSVPSDKEMTSSVYFYVDATILARAAKMFHKTEDYKKYSQLAQEIKEAVNKKFFHPETATYASGTQTELSVPLYWGIVPEEYRAQVAAALNQKVLDSNYHLDVGVLGCKALLNALCENGYAETAYRVAIQDTYPSWGWWVANGSTTLRENWDLKATRDISDNHMMFGEIGAWFYKGLGGIYPDDKKPGFRHIRLRPYFPADLQRFTARHTCPYGEIVSGWTRKGKKVSYQVTVPANCSATLQIPAGYSAGKDTADTLELTSGTHTIELKSK